MDPEQNGYEITAILPTATPEQAEALMEFLSTMFPDSAVIVHPLEADEEVMSG